MRIHSRVFISFIFAVSVWAGGAALKDGRVPFDFEVMNYLRP